MADAARLSVVEGRVVWQEYVPDPRWRRGWTRLMIHDLATGRRRQLGAEGRLEAPAFSPDGARIAAIEFTAESICSLVILDAKSGVIQRYPVAAGEFLLTPAWSPDGRSIAVVRQSPNGMKGLSIFAIGLGTFAELTPPSREDLTYPEFTGEYVLYGSPLSGIDNIYAVHIGTKARYQVTSVRLGAYYPHASRDGRRLLFSDCSTDGFNIAEQDLDPSSWRPIESVESTDFHYHETGARDYTAEVPSTAFESRPYRPLGHLINVHSWGVTSPPPDMGFGVHSTDKMGLLDLTASLKYDWNEHTTGYEAAASFNALYPVLDFGFSRKNREVRYSDHTSKWTERTARAGFHVPLNLSRGYYKTWLVTGASVESRHIGHGTLLPLNYWLSFDRFRDASPRDVAPAWGQSAFVSYQHTPWSTDYHGDLVTAIGSAYLPSPVRHHSIRLEVANERRHGGNYYFSSQMLFPRGYDSVVDGTLWKGSANYLLPVAYPEAALGQLAYLKRITANLFFDYGRTDERMYRSAGVEALFDVHALSLREAIRVGLRYSYRIDSGKGAAIEPFVAFRW